VTYFEWDGWQTVVGDFQNIKMRLGDWFNGRGPQPEGRRSTGNWFPITGMTLERSVAYATDRDGQKSVLHGVRIARPDTD
jgi:hypothetical protein